MILKNFLDLGASEKLRRVTSVTSSKLLPRLHLQSMYRIQDCVSYKPLSAYNQLTKVKIIRDYFIQMHRRILSRHVVLRWRLLNWLRSRFYRCPRRIRGSSTACATAETFKHNIYTVRRHIFGVHDDFPVNWIYFMTTKSDHTPLDVPLTYPRTWIKHKQSWHFIAHLPFHHRTLRGDFNSFLSLVQRLRVFSTSCWLASSWLSQCSSSHWACTYRTQNYWRLWTDITIVKLPKGSFALKKI